MHTMLRANVIRTRGLCQAPIPTFQHPNNLTVQQPRSRNVVARAQGENRNELMMKAREVVQVCVLRV
jgi:hypothetical protein